MKRGTTERGIVCRLTCGAILIVSAFAMLARVVLYADGGGGGGGTLQIIATSFGNNTNATGISGWLCDPRLVFSSVQRSSVPNVRRLHTDFPLDGCVGRAGY